MQRLVLPIVASILLLAACRKMESAEAPSKREDIPWPAKPAGGEPVALQFVKMVGTAQGRGAEMTAFNFGSKDVQGLMLELHYLDATGKELQTFPFSLVSPLIVASGDHAAVQVGAFVPERTASVRADVENVTYKDGTSWQKK